MIALWVEEGGITGTVFGSSMYAYEALSNLPINQFLFLSAFQDFILKLLNRFHEKIGCLGQSMIALWVEGGSITGAVLGSSM